ncbi:YscQ/HrcQ family type III secretion apparatus protein [Burkholderia sp. Bp9126]|nr:YscQ/HrcQ family type III secretion apparatus protein [Burkholderia sp. Bp9126]
MLAVRVDRATGALLRAVGPGRQLLLDSCSLTMRFCTSGGTGLILETRTGDGPVRMWIETAQWCRWIEPVLSVPDWNAVPVEMRDVLAAWTWVDIANGLERIGITSLASPSIKCGACPSEPAWTLSLERTDAVLDMRVIDVPYGLLEQLAAQMGPLTPDSPNSPDQAPVVRLALSAGWCNIGASTLDSLQPGDALLFTHAYAVADGELALFADRPLAIVSQCRTGPYTIGMSIDMFDDWLDVEPPSRSASSPIPLDARVQVVAQVATIDIPLSQLANLRPGDVLDGPAQSDGLVTLRVAGKPLARGTLLDIGGRLAVRIEYLTPC